MDKRDNEFRALIFKLGITQAMAARILGLSQRAVQGYAIGERKAPEPVMRLLRLHLKMLGRD